MPLLSNARKYRIHIDSLFVLHYPQSIAYDRNPVLFGMTYWLNREYITFKQLWDDMMMINKLHQVS